MAEAAQYTPGDEMHELALEEFDMARGWKMRDLQNPPLHDCRGFRVASFCYFGTFEKSIVHQRSRKIGS